MADDAQQCARPGRYDGGRTGRKRGAAALAATVGALALAASILATGGGDGGQPPPPASALVRRRAAVRTAADSVLAETNALPRVLQSPEGTGNATDVGCPPAPPAVTEATLNLPAAATWILVVFLVGMSALFSGLTLGLMSLDKTGLEIVMEGGDPALSKAAASIYPVRSDGNRLLCTLLLGNVAVNALLSILIADVAGGIAGFLVSTAVIVVFGEIIPQAACSRYALQIGSRAVPVVKGIMFLLLPLAVPLGWALDKLLGQELGTTYSNAELTKLLEIHVKEGRFGPETGTAMTGALRYHDVAVKEVMTPLEQTYMLSADTRLGFDTIAEIFRTGFSRIPVYEVSKDNIIGLLFTKDLIFIDPEDETPVRSFVGIFGRGLHVVWPDDRLGDVLRDLKKGHSHMALVRDVNSDDSTQDPYYEISGIITLEDIIEIILGDEIVDETDAFTDRTHSAKVDRSAADFDWARLRLLDAKLVEKTLADEEVRAVTAHLRTNYSDAVKLLSDRQLARLVAETPVTELQEAERDVSDDLPMDLLYEKGAPSDSCTLILGGKVTVLAGSDNFRADVSSWTVLAPNALTDPTFRPDFTAYVSSGPCRALRIRRGAFAEAVDVSAVERRGKGQAPVPDSPPAVAVPRSPARQSSEEAQSALADPDAALGLDLAVPDAGASDGDVEIGGGAASADAAADAKVSDKQLKMIEHRQHRSKLLVAFRNKSKAKDVGGSSAEREGTAGSDAEPAAPSSDRSDRSASFALKGLSGRKSYQESQT